MKKGDTLCIIEAMKLMNEFPSEVDGTVAEICVGNGQVVEMCIRDRVNNAGTAWKGLFTDMALADWQGVLDEMCIRDRTCPPPLRNARGRIALSGHGPRSCRRQRGRLLTAGAF